MNQQNMPTTPGMPATPGMPTGQPQMLQPAPTMQQVQPAPTMQQVQPQAMPQAMPQPVQHDFSAGENAQVMDGGGPKLDAGTYWLTYSGVQYRKSENPQSGGEMLVIIESTVLKNCSPVGGTEVGSARALVLHSNNTFAYWPGIKRFIAALRGIEDPNQARTNDLNFILNDPRTYEGVTLRVSVVDKESKGGNPYKVYQYDGIVSDEDVAQYLLGNEHVAASVFPKGLRPQMGLGGPNEYFGAPQQ